MSAIDKIEKNKKSGNPFIDNDNRDQVAAAFEHKATTETSPTAKTDVSALAQLQARRKNRKQSVSMTLDPEMTEQMTALAKKNGYSSLSAYARDIFQAILDSEKA